MLLCSDSTFSLSFIVGACRKLQLAISENGQTDSNLALTMYTPSVEAKMDFSFHGEIIIIVVIDSAFVGRQDIA